MGAGQGHEAFYQEIADEAGIESWEMDRLVFRFNGHFLEAIEKPATEA